MPQDANKSKGPFHFRVYDTLWTSGLAAKLDPAPFRMLLTLGRHMRPDGVCWPSQECLAKELGTSVTTVSKHIRRLLELRWNGQPLVTATKDPRFGNYVYRLNPICQLACGEKKPAPIESESTPTEEKRSNSMEKARLAKAQRRQSKPAQGTVSNQFAVTQRIVADAP